MIKSMTGFGRAEAIDRERKITVELKSVNHRYLDLNVKVPRKLSFLEGEIRNLLKDKIRRGKVDVFISYEDYTLSGSALKYNRELAREYLEYFKSMAEEFGIVNDVGVSGLSRYPEVFTMEEQSLDEEELWSRLKPVLQEACGQFMEAREREGSCLKADLLEKLEGLDEKVTQVEERSPLVVDSYREKLEAKIREVLEDSQLDESRVAAEVVIYSDKICNDEETVRLHSHIAGMREILEEEEGVGRKLDFMAQEMNREANTILSKSGDLTISNIAIDLKTEIEKIREQIQNLE
ncbi:MAG: YicC/YloC family endoribonuclease [Eubacteriales bacterium]|nr:YicC/YloC family endoribonuclease [Eubacteriales bacterium]